MEREILTSRLWRLWLIAVCAVLVWHSKPRAEQGQQLLAEFETFYEANYGGYFCFQDGGDSVPMTGLEIRWVWSDTEKAVWFEEVLGPDRIDGYYLRFDELRYIVWTETYQCNTGPTYQVRVVCRKRCMYSYDPSEGGVFGFQRPTDDTTAAGGAFWLTFRSEEDAKRIAAMLEQIIELARQ